MQQYRNFCADIFFRCYVNAFAFQLCQRIAHQVVCAQGMVQPCVNSAGVYQVGKRHMLDTAQALLTPDGQTQPEFYLGDKLHMTDKGYAVWNAMLRPMLVDGATSATGRCAQPAAASSVK